MALIKQLLDDEQGAAMAEYALLVALIAVAVIGTMGNRLQIQALGRRYVTVCLQWLCIPPP